MWDSKAICQHFANNKAYQRDAFVHLGHEKRLEERRGFAFVTSTPRGQPAAEDRKLIRSHVMKGKNTKKRRPLGRLDGGASSTTLAVPSPDEHTGGNNSPEESNESQCGHEIPCKDASTWCGGPSLLPRAASAFTFSTFPEEIDVESRVMISTYFTYLKENMYPIARYSCSDAGDGYWFHWTQVDLAYLHSILFTTSFFYDSLKGQNSQRTRYHSYRTISELNKQLADSNTALSDSTTTVVMAMALVAGCFGDVESSHIHLAGLKRIIDLRGGMASYINRPLLQSKLYRAGLIYSICTGSEPVFAKEAPTNVSAFDHLPRLARLKPSPTSSFSRSRAFVRDLDQSLYITFKDIQRLSQLLNNSFETGDKIQQIALEDLLTSVQSRLLKLAFHDNANNMSELLRLSLVAYLTTVFWNFPGLKFDYPHLATHLRVACLAFSPTTVTEKRHYAWALMVGAISLYHGHDQAWLRQRLYPLIPDYLGSTWLEARESLSQVMWIGSIHDCSAIEVFGLFLETVIHAT